MLAAFVVQAQQGAVRKISQHFLPAQPIHDVWGYTDANTGREYALACSGGVVIFDVTDPANPEQIAMVPAEADFDVKVWQHYAYTVTGAGGEDGGLVIDLTDPANPVVVGTFPSAHNLFIDEQGFMYASNPQLIIYDLKPDPTSPQQVWVDGSGGDGHDVMVKHNRLFDFHGYRGTFIYELADPTNPELVAHIEDAGMRYHHGGDVSAKGNVLYICDELALDAQADVTIWDISDLGNITRIGSIADPDATMHNFYLIGDYAYTSHYAAGFRVYDASTYGELSLVTSYDTSPHAEEGYVGAFGIFPFHGLDRIYITDRDSGLVILSTTEQQIQQQARINVLQEGEAIAYPNPVQGAFAIEMQATNLQHATVSLHDTAGRLVAHGRTQQLNGYLRATFDASALRAGSYLARISWDGGSDVVRVVVE